MSIRNPAHDQVSPLGKVGAKNNRQSIEATKLEPISENHKKERQPTSDGQVIQKEGGGDAVAFKSPEKGEAGNVSNRAKA